VIESIPVLIMMPPHGPSPAESWVGRGIQAAGLDLINRMKDLEFDLELFVLAAEEEDRELARMHGAHVLRGSREAFHFGKALTSFIAEKNVGNVAYFGSGSAPLISREILHGCFLNVLHANHPYAVVNNLHSTDWAIISQADRLLGISDRLPSDNPIGWVLSHEIGFEVKALSISAGTRADIDTPSDLLMMYDHPGLGPNLQEFYLKEPVFKLDKLKATINVLSTPASHLTLIGRASSHLLQELERKTQIWIRMFVEERGMIASGRMERGEVRSLMAEIVDRWGPHEFIDYLGEISDAVLWDTRVWMAHHGGWPSKADRFASDLGRVEEIHDPSLKELTEAVYQADFPIIVGGHGVVAGGLYALLETTFPDEDYQPNK
jgi:hypothetical protein